MLERLKNLKNDIRAAVIGTGFMGKGMIYQSLITPGFRCVAIADIDLTKAISCAEELDLDFQVVHTLADMHDAIRNNRTAVCEDGDLVARCEMVDVLFEVSNSIIEAAGFAVTALEHGKHLVLMNAELDLIFGPYFMQLARANGVTYTTCDGDQPGVIKRLINDLQFWGFDLVMAGNIKGFLDRYSNPTKIIPEADKRNLGYKMATAFTDGTKVNIEMALIANALDLEILVPGMRGPRASHVRDVFYLFDFDDLWTTRQPFADYILGADPGGGIFAVGYCDSKLQQSMLSYYKFRAPDIT